MTKKEIEELDQYTMGKHDIDKKPINSIRDEDDEDFDAKIRVETEPVFKRLARDIYKDDSAGIRESVTNAVTAVLRAIEYDYIDEDEGVIRVRLDKSGKRNELTIRDNGIGMTMKKIKQIVSVMGASEARDIGDLVGQFGMGFMAMFRLVGVDGAFDMSTNPRYSNEGPITGIWKSGGFTKDEKEMVSDKLSDNEYGTKFGLYLKEDISAEDIREWVEKYCNWCRVPVVYEEITDGRTDFEEDYGGFNKKITDGYSDGSPVVQYEDEYIHIASSPEASGRTVLLDVECNRQISSTISVSTILGKIDVRLKDENGTIFKGPNKGDMVVSEGEYYSMEDERKENYIPKPHLSSDDIVLPKPVGTRQTLGKEPDFWEWVTSKLEKSIKNNINDIVESVSNLEEILNLSENEYRLLCLAASKPVNGTNHRSFEPDLLASELQNWFKNTFGKSLDDEISKCLVALTYTLKYIDRNANNISSKYGPNRRSKEPAIAVYQAYNNDGDIFMACRPTKKKADVIWEDNENNYLFRLNNSDQYEFYEDILGWRKLTDISGSNIDEFDVSDSTKKQFYNSNSKSKNNNKHVLKLHISNKANQKSGSRSITVSELKSKLEENKNNSSISIKSREVDKIILFPTHRDKNISDNYWASSRRTAICRCRKKDWNRLKEYNKIYTLDEALKESKNVSFKTNIGETTISSVESEYDEHEYRIMFHILEDPYQKLFTKPEIMEKIVEHIEESYLNDLNCIYAPVTPDIIPKLRPGIMNHFILRGSFGYGGHMRSIPSRTLDSMKRSYKIRSDSVIYARARLYEWKNTNEYNVLLKNIRRVGLDEGGYDIIETMRKGFNQEPNSQSEDALENN